MWTPKRLLILLGGLVLSMTGYLIYAFFLGGIDGLPLLSEDYLPIYVNGGIPPLPAPSDGEIDKKLKQAFGTECEEWRRPLLLNLTSKGILLAANQCDIETDGRVKLYPFSAALFPKNNRPDAPFPEINTVQCETAFLTLDRPVSHFSELSTRKIIGVELRGNRGITMINNRRTAEKNDDLDLLITNGPMFYAEKINKIWTDGYVQLLDNQTQPNPTKITAKGMDLKLAENTGPNRIKSPKTQVKGKNEGKNDGLNGVEMLILKSNVDMHLYVDASSGFLAGSTDLGKKQPPKGPMGEQPEKSHVIIKTNGPFHYDLTRELAWFDSPPVNAGAAPSSPASGSALLPGGLARFGLRFSVMLSSMPRGMSMC